MFYTKEEFLALREDLLTIVREEYYNDDSLIKIMKRSNYNNESIYRILCSKEFLNRNTHSEDYRNRVRKCLYELPLDQMPLYINGDEVVRIISRWRLKIGR